MPFRARRLAAAIAPATVALSVLVGHAAPAAAHALLMSSDPAVNATVAPGSVAITLNYNSRLDLHRSRVTLSGGATDPARPIVLTLAPGQAPGQVVSVATLTPGSYVLHWQVLAEDGHITRGDVPFAVRAP